MKTRKLGSTDLQLSTVGLGTWPMGGVSAGMHWGAQDDQASIETIEHAMDQGINWLDTAGAYGRGHSEEVVGMALKKLSTRPIIVTKCGSTPEDTMEPGSVRKQCEASLKRMGIDTIDLYLAHWPRPIEMMEAGWQTCADLVKEGKVRYIGVSNYTIEQMEKIQPIHPIAAMEPPYSMITRGIEDKILPYCREHNMGVVIYSPLQQGVLTGAPISADAMDEGDFRRNNPHFKEPVLSLNIRLVEELRPIAQKYGGSIAQLAIAWVLRRSDVTSALNGARIPAEIEDSVLGGDLEISAEDIAAIEKLLEKREKEMPPPPPPPGSPAGRP
ncbi:MAG: aldo/keto reductase [Dehalococcoidales bacterium]